MNAQLLHHLRDPADVIVATADEATKRFPGGLLQNADASELRRLAGEVGIGQRPLGVKVA